MKLYSFRKDRDNIVREDMAQTFDWPELVEFFSEHIITDEDPEEKRGLAFIAGEFNTSSTAEPAIWTSGTGDSYTEHLILDDFNRPQPRRCANNLISQSALCLDIDNGWTIEEAKQDLAGLRYLGYTSWNHLAPGKGERFRIVLPLTDPCPKEEWTARRADIQSHWPQVDRGCIDCARVMFYPAVPASRAHLAHTWSNEGEILDWRLFNPTPPPPEPIPFNRSLLEPGESGAGEPVWETFDLLQLMRDHGHYIKQCGSSQHKVICPNFRAHTGGATGGTVMWQNGSERPKFYCSHDHCRDFNIMRHFKQQLGPGWINRYIQRRPVETNRQKMNTTLTLLKNKRGQHEHN